MDQLADLLRARCASANGADEVPEGVRALLVCLDQGAAPRGTGSAAENAAANAALSSSSPPSAPPSSLSFGVDVSVHGPGAAGSTHLANFLLREAGLRCNLLIDPDGQRHAPWPPPPPSTPRPTPATGPAGGGSAQRPPAARASLLYLYSDDPLLAAASFYRRGIAAEQALKVSGAAAALASASAPRDLAPEAKARARAALALAAAAAAGDGSTGFPPTLDAFLERGEDLFGLDAHLGGWLSRPAASEVVFLRYEGAFEQKGGVARALFRRLLGEARARRRRWGAQDEKGEEDDGELDARAERLASEWCAQRRERRTQLSAQQRERGERVFSAFSARARALPHGGCFVRPADASTSSSPEEWEALM